jgi:hypothetical protein
MTGRYALRISAEDGIPYIEPIDHFGPEELGVATMETDSANADAETFGTPPMYLADDYVVAVALEAARRSVFVGASECHSGPRGEACGSCPVCNRAKRRMFTWTIMGSIELPEMEMSRMVKEAVSSVIGLSRLCSSKAKSASQEEADAIIAEIKGWKETTK